MSAPPLQNLKLQELLEHNGLRVWLAATNTFCVYFQSPEGATGSPVIEVTPLMLNRGLDPMREKHKELVVIQPRQGVQLSMSMDLPHRVDEDTVQSVELSELDSDAAPLKGRLVFASKGRRGAELFVVEAYNASAGRWARNFVRPGQAIMVAKITYQVAPDRWRVREGEAA